MYLGNITRHLFSFIRQTILYSVKFNFSKLTFINFRWTQNFLLRRLTALYFWSDFFGKLFWYSTLYSFNNKSLNVLFYNFYYNFSKIFCIDYKKNNKNEKVISKNPSSRNSRTNVYLTTFGNNFWTIFAIKEIIYVSNFTDHITRNNVDEIIMFYISYICQTEKPISLGK